MTQKLCAPPSIKGPDGKVIEQNAAGQLDISCETLSAWMAQCGLDTYGEIVENEDGSFTWTSADGATTHDWEADDDVEPEVATEAGMAANGPYLPGDLLVTLDDDAGTVLCIPGKPGGAPLVDAGGVPIPADSGPNGDASCVTPGTNKKVAGIESPVAKGDIVRTRDEPQIIAQTIVDLMPVDAWEQTQFSEADDFIIAWQGVDTVITAPCDMHVECDMLAFFFEVNPTAMDGKYRRIKPTAVLLAAGQPGGGWAGEISTMMWSTEMTTDGTVGQAGTLGAAGAQNAGLSFSGDVSFANFFLAQGQSETLTAALRVAQTDFALEPGPALEASGATGALFTEIVMTEV